MARDDALGRDRGIAPQRAELSSVIAERAAPVIEAMSRSGAAVLLIGEAGSGKAYLAEHTANAVQAADAVRSFVLPHPSYSSAAPEEVFGETFPSAFPDVTGPEPDGRAYEANRIASELLEAIAAETRAESATGSSDSSGSSSDAAGPGRAGPGAPEAMLVLPGVDRYSPLSAAVLKNLVRGGRVRVLATAHRLIGGADLMGRDPRVARIAVGPLDLEEADAFLSYLLGASHIAPETLRRWHAATGGNSYAITMLALAAERRGVLRRRRGLAWVPAGLDEIPEEFGDYIDRTCSDAERAALEIISLAEPVIEPPLLRLLDPVATDVLLDRNLISSRRHPDGQTALSITRPILSTAIRNRMSPQRRMQLAGRCFDALETEAALPGLTGIPQHLVSRVVFGLEAGRQVPHDWLVRALAALSLGYDPHLVLRVALALARDFASEDAAAAALRAVSFSTLLSDASALDAAHRVIGELLADERACRLLPPALRVRLHLVQIEHRFRLGAAMAAVHEELDRIEATIAPDDAVSQEEIRCARFEMVLASGDLAGAYAIRPDDAISSNITIEWVRAGARSGVALILQQQGRLEGAIRIAERARRLALMGKRPLRDVSEVQNLCWFFGYWASGSAESGRRAIGEVESQSGAGLQAGAHLSGAAVEVGRAMLALQEARWREAADLAEMLVERFDACDPHGMAPLISAMQALALAALGEQEEALHSLHRARIEQRGFSQAAAGFLRRLIVQTLQWLGVGDVGSEALALADWAEAQGLRLIELEALHIAAFESAPLAGKVRQRAQELAAEVDPLIGDVILAHIEKIADGASPADVAEPEVRLLADLGLWAPLPKAPGLSAREREVALFASLGYTSRFIAERLYLSVRTVETHLAHVYSKLGIADRDELRRWFSVDRAIEERGFAA